MAKKKKSNAAVKKVKALSSLRKRFAKLKSRHQSEQAQTLLEMLVGRSVDEVCERLELERDMVLARLTRGGYEGWLGDPSYLSDEEIAARIEKYKPSAEAMKVCHPLDDDYHESFPALVDEYIKKGYLPEVALLLARADWAEGEEM